MFLSPFITPLLLLPFVLLATAVGLILLAFAVAGGPAPCDPGGGPIVISEQNADAFEQKWDEFDAALDAGSSATVTFTESEISSRAIRETEGAVDDQDVLQDVRVCVHDGYGEISGNLNLPSFLDTKFKIRGTAYIDETLNVHVDDVEIGSLPGFVSDWVREFPDNTIEALDEDDFGHNYVLTLREGEAHIDGTP